MKVMVISDLHYDKRVYKGVDESRAWFWLMNIVDYHKPDLLLSCGDWGAGVNLEEFYELLKKTVVLTIYGNHENMDVLSKPYNVKTSEYLPVLMEDGKVYEFNNLKIAGINGIIAKKRRFKKGVPRRLTVNHIIYYPTYSRIQAKQLTNPRMNIPTRHNHQPANDFHPFYKLIL